MTTIVINSDRAIQLLREVVEGRENFVYDVDELCRYQLDGEPACLIGQALHKAGVSVYDLQIMDDGGVFTSIDTVTSPPNFDLTAGARYVFAAAQEKQDARRTWGNALEEAEIVYAYCVKEELL